MKVLLSLPMLHLYARGTLGLRRHFHSHCSPQVLRVICYVPYLSFLISLLLLENWLLFVDSVLVL